MMFDGAKITKLKNFESWGYFASNNLFMSKPKDVFFITYASGTPCYEANMFMSKLLHESKATTTLRTYANQIIHLVNFVEKQPTVCNFSQLTDSTFRLFVQNLQLERNALGELRRNNNQVITIAHCCLRFLMFVQEFCDIKNFIGKEKVNAIKVIEKKYKISIEGLKGRLERTVITHNCIPSKDEVRRRLPVSEDSALKVWKHISTQKNKDKRYRDIAIYQTMEQLGGRVSELHMLTVADFNKARESGDNPYIKLTTLKRQDDKSSRYIPVTNSLLHDIAQYLKVRRKITKKKKMKHDCLFISLTTGQPFSADSWTTYLNSWKRVLGIEGELHPHLYRHAFISEKLKEIILTHKEINSADDFRKHLLNTENFKLQLQQWTGHTQLSSLNTYIHLAFEDINGMAEVYNSVSLKDSVKLVKRQIKSVKLQLEDKEIGLAESIEQLKNIIDGFEVDIDNCIRS